jgi:hypothetical protein
MLQLEFTRPRNNEALIFQAAVEVVRVCGTLLAEA